MVYRGEQMTWRPPEDNYDLRRQWAEMTPEAREKFARRMEEVERRREAERQATIGTAPEARGSKRVMRNCSMRLSIGLGQKLPKWLDPLPAFDAVMWTLNGNEIVVVRAWRSERAPIVHTGNAARSARWSSRSRRGGSYGRRRISGWQRLLLSSTVTRGDPGDTPAAVRRGRRALTRRRGLRARNSSARDCSTRRKPCGFARHQTHTAGGVGVGDLPLHAGRQNTYGSANVTSSPRRTPRDHRVRVGRRGLGSICRSSRARARRSACPGVRRRGLIRLRSRRRAPCARRGAAIVTTRRASFSGAVEGSGAQSWKGSCSFL
jgi:hypothetical protein